MTVDEQRLSALRAANEVRAAKAQLKRAIKMGEQDPIRCLQEREEYEWLLRSTPIGQFLTWMPYVGKVRAANLCRKVGCTTQLRVHLLTDAQVERIADLAPVKGVRR